MGEPYHLSLNDVLGLTLPQIMCLRSGGKPLDRGAAWDTYEDFARYRAML